MNSRPEFRKSRVAHKHARNGQALCDTKLNTLVAQSRHFSKRSAYACSLSSAHLRLVVRSPVTFAVRTVLAYTSLCLCELQRTCWMRILRGPGTFVFYATYEETLETAHYTSITRFLLLCVSRFPWFWCSCHVVGFLTGDASYHDPNVSPPGMTILPAFRTPDGHQNGFCWKCVAHSCIFYPATATHIYAIQASERSPQLVHRVCPLYSPMATCWTGSPSMSFTWSQGSVSVAEKYMSIVLAMEAGRCGAPPARPQQCVLDG